MDSQFFRERASNILEDNNQTVARVKIIENEIQDIVEASLSVTDRQRIQTLRQEQDRCNQTTLMQQGAYNEMLSLADYMDKADEANHRNGAVDNVAVQETPIQLHREA